LCVEKYSWKYNPIYKRNEANHWSNRPPAANELMNFLGVRAANNSNRPVILFALDLKGAFFSSEQKINALDQFIYLKETQHVDTCTSTLRCGGVFQRYILRNKLLTLLTARPACKIYS
jgi:hypothetical protein